MREEGKTCSWEVHGSIAVFVRVHDGEPEMVTPVHQAGGFDVTNSMSGEFMDCAERYKGDVDAVRRKIEDRLPFTIASDLPTVRRLIGSLPNVVAVTWPSPTAHP